MEFSTFQGLITSIIIISAVLLVGRNLFQQIKPGPDRSCNGCAGNCSVVPKE
ncbi:MAG: FeoB-associated Cys-rich membrane protein [Candidatus Marinimicrobia bacterium]|nr:FeoB-associated Cys-rich membrane protein [Candidatus Neomarinimicrobiota bacterium]